MQPSMCLSSSPIDRLIDPEVVTKVRSIVKLFCRRYEDIDDAIQEAYAWTLKAIKNGTAHNAEAYLVGTAKAVSVSRFSKKNKKNRDSDQITEEMTETIPHDEPPYDWRADELRSLMKRLDNRQREMLCRYIEGQGDEQISREMGFSTLHATRCYRSRVIARLRDIRRERIISDAECMTMRKLLRLQQRSG